MRTKSGALPAFVGAFAVAWTLGTAEVAAASCAELPSLSESIAEAGTAFVGVVTEVSNENRTAAFRVEEVWKGAVSETVIVNGGPPLRAVAEAERKGLGIASSVDRRFRLGWRYLVMPPRSRGRVLQDNSCSATRPYAEELDRLRPPDAQTMAVEASPPGSTPPAGSSGIARWIVAGLVVVGAGALGSAGWLRRRAAGSS